MKVYFDEQAFTLQSRGGVSRYFVELMKAFRSDGSYRIEVTTPRLWSANEHLIDAGMGRRLPDPPSHRKEVHRAANLLLRGAGIPDLVHHTYYARGYLRQHRARARVVTVYDMIPELFPKLFPRGNPHLDKRKYVARADLIVCISEATRKDLVDIYGTPSARTVVTPLGVDPEFQPGATRPPGLPDRYVLFVGDRVGYKDFVVLAKAFAATSDPHVHLVAVGGGAWRDVERALLERLGIAARSHQRTLSDADLAGAYANALCFVFPSRYEGFGLPTLEAMACGCPTILVHSSSHPEVGGSAALYFPPEDDAELTRLLDRVVGDDARRDQLASAGLAQARTFGWDRTARLTADAYVSLVGGL